MSFVIIDSNSDESSNTVPYWSGGILSAVSEVEKAITGLQRWIWREISGFVQAGFEGEIMTPRVKRE